MGLLIWMLCLIVVADINLVLVISCGIGMGWAIIGLLWFGVRKLVDALYKKCIEPKVTTKTLNIIRIATIFLIVVLGIINLALSKYIFLSYDELYISNVLALSLAAPYLLIVMAVVGLIIYGIAGIHDSAKNAAEKSKYKKYYKNAVVDFNEENFKVLFSLSSRDIQKGENLIDNNGRVKDMSSMKEIANKMAAEGEFELYLAVEKNTLVPHKLLKNRQNGKKILFKTTYAELNRCIQMNEKVFAKYKKLSQENIKNFLN